VNGKFDVKKNKFVIRIDAEDKELSYKELEDLFNIKVEEVSLIYKLLTKYPTLIKD